MQIFQIVEAEIPKSVEERIEDILKEIKKKKMEFVEEYQIDKPIYFKNYCISDSDLDYYDNTHFVEARKYITGRLRKLAKFVYQNVNYFYIYT